MAIAILEKRQYQRNLILVFAVVILLIFFVVWRGFFSKEKTSSVTVGNVVSLRKIEINFETLKSPSLKELYPFEEIKPLDEKTEVGRKNPFISY